MRKLVLTLIILCLTLSIMAQDDLPEIRIHVSDNPAEGYIYLATLRRSIPGENRTPRHLLLIDNEGNIVYSEPIRRVFNFGRAINGLRYYFAFSENGPGRGASTDGVYRKPCQNLC